MTEVLTGLLFAVTLVFYTGASILFYLDAARHRVLGIDGVRSASDPSARRRVAPSILAAGAVANSAYVVVASVNAHVCPIYSVHFLLSIASLFATAAYLALRVRFRVDALGLLVSPLDLAFALGTYLLGKPVPEPRLSPLFITVHIVANTLGVALVLLAALSALLYFVPRKANQTKVACHYQPAASRHPRSRRAPVSRRGVSLAHAGDPERNLLGS